MTHIEISFMQYPLSTIEVDEQWEISFFEFVVVFIVIIVIIGRIPGLLGEIPTLFSGTDSPVSAYICLSPLRR